MTTTPALAHRLFVSACAATRTTERATHRLGVAAFLPRLFAARFTHLGGIDAEEFRSQLAGCRSFVDARWVDYWGGIAARHYDRADAALRALGGPDARRLCDPGARVDVAGLGELLAPAVALLADRGAVADPDAVARFCAQYPELSDAAVAVDGLIKALVYEFLAGWPGWSPRRLQAYERSRRLGEVLMLALAPAMDLTVEVLEIPIDEAAVLRGYLVLPPGNAHAPVVLVTNGLEGTREEVLLPMLAYRGAGLGMFVMEMPGTYLSAQPLAPDAERIYATVLDRLAAHPGVDRDRIGMLGVSFGGYWAVRMAAADPRVKVAVANGTPSRRSFRGASVLGMPDILISTLRSATAATSVVDMSRKLARLAIEDRYDRIQVPLLVVNGAHDTLIGTQASIDIAVHAPHAHLVLYADDDHCAMGHAEQWSDLSFAFLRDHLTEGMSTPAKAAAKATSHASGLCI